MNTACSISEIDESPITRAVQRYNAAFGAAVLLPLDVSRYADRETVKALSELARLKGRPDIAAAFDAVIAG